MVNKAENLTWQMDLVPQFFDIPMASVKLTITVTVTYVQSPDQPEERRHLIEYEDGRKHFITEKLYLPKYERRILQAAGSPPFEFGVTYFDFHEIFFH